MNVQEWSQHLVLLAYSYSLPNALGARPRQALVPHLNFQKRSRADAVSTFGLGNVLRATSQLPKLLQTKVCFARVESEMRFAHNGVHFFHLSTSKSAPNSKCYVMLCVFTS